MNYEWGLRIATNNQAEALAILQGLKTMDSSRAKNIIVIGDSSIFIKLMNSLNTPSDGKLVRFTA